MHDRGAVLMIMSIVLTVVALALVAMRFVSRLLSKRQLGLDDYAILLSLVRFTTSARIVNNWTISLMNSRFSQLDSHRQTALVSLRWLGGFSEANELSRCRSRLWPTVDFVITRRCAGSTRGKICPNIRICVLKEHTKRPCRVSGPTRSSIS